MAQARAWISHWPTPKPSSPGTLPKFKLPRRRQQEPGHGAAVVGRPFGGGQTKSYGNYPAVQHIMSSVFEGGLMDFDSASEVESRYFAACVMSQESKNMINTLWYQLNAHEEGRFAARRRAGQPKVKKLGILGAGMMGAGIAYVSAKVGIEVVLLDTSQEAAERGKAYSQGLLDKAVKKGRSTPEQRDALLARITPTTALRRWQGCDLVIEAVFEDRAIKADVTRQAEAQLGCRTAVFASNTSTLPITGLAQASVRPAQFIGLHFFSPVDKMPLVEIIVGKDTDNATLARAFDYVLQIGKTPIVVNDSRGFYTSRVFGTYVMEGIAMLKRRCAPAQHRGGGPAGRHAHAAAGAAGRGVAVAGLARGRPGQEGPGRRGQGPYPEHPGLAVVRQLCEMGRVGKKVGKGFYDWTEDGKVLWSELKQHFPVAHAATGPARADRPPDVCPGQRSRPLLPGKGAALGGRRQHRQHLRLGFCALPRGRAAVHQRHGRGGLRQALARAGGPLWPTL